MKEILRAIRGWFLLIFVGHPAKAPSRPKDPSRGKDAEEAGYWYFKRDILDQLGNYFKYICKMKKTDPEGYRMYSKIGAAIAPFRIEVRTRLETIWKRSETRPGFGAVAYGRNYGDKDTVPMKFGYFRRIDRPLPIIELALGQVYRVVMFHADRGERMTPRNISGFSSEFYVEIDDAARVHPLRHVQKTTQNIHHHDAVAKNGAFRVSKITHTRFAYGVFLEEPEDFDPAHFRTPQQRAEIIFSLIANNYQQASGALRIAITKRNITAMFGLDLLRTPYFFDEREPTYTDRGAKKRILHIVRTHHRRLAGGKGTFVKSHFRGEREFQWKGYHVLISMPGKHHADLLAATFGSHDYDVDETVPKGMLGQAAFVDIISKHLRRTAAWLTPNH